MLCSVLFAVLAAGAEPATVLHKEGLVHGYLVLTDLGGERLADGELLQTAKGERVTSRLVLRFKDGSLDDETAVFSQDGQLRLLSDHLIQRGPAFKKPIDLSIDVRAGEVVVKSGDKVERQKMDLPADLANGIIPIVLKNVPRGGALPSMSMVVATPKPRLVKLVTTVDGEDRFVTGGAAHRATRYKLHVDIGGVEGAFAPLVGKQPPDSKVWVSGDEVPTFVKAEEPLFADAPLWRLELVSPAWR
ncbi:MAG: hypothetical protein QM723_21080 [Myxococcaceae bacterium]